MMKRTVHLAVLLSLLGSFLVSCAQNRRPRTIGRPYASSPLNDPTGEWNVIKRGGDTRIKYGL